MSASRILLQLEQRAIAAENLITSLKREITQLEVGAKATNSENHLARLKQENETLRAEVELWKEKLVQVGVSKGIRQFSTSAAKETEVNRAEEKQVTSPAVNIEQAPKKEKVARDDKKKKEQNKKAETTAKVEEDDVIDIGRVDLRIGKIVAVKKHPDADSLYVEEVDVGEGKTRTIVSGLVKHVPIEEMINRIAIFMCNLKPAKMRGITSEGMLMCASTPEKVEILLPPSGAVAGDLVHVDGYNRRPDAVMNPKKKIWETVAPDLKTNSNKEATYKGVILTIPGKGPITSATLANVQIK